MSEHPLDPASLEQSLLAWEDAARARPDDAEPHVNRGHALWQLQRKDAALEAYAQALRLNPALPAVELWRGRLLADLGGYEEALACFGRAAALDPALPGLLFAEGSALCRLQRFDEALAKLEQVVRAEPKDSHALALQAWILRRLDRPAEARKLAEQAFLVRGSSMEPQAQAELIGRLATTTQGLLEADLEALEQRVCEDPEDLAARIQLIGYAHLGSLLSGRRARMGAERRAIPHAEWMVRNHSGLPGLSMVVGHCTGMNPEYASRLREAWLEVLRTKPDDVPALENAAQSLQWADPELAEETYRRLIALQPALAKWRDELARLILRGSHMPMAEDVRGAARRALELLEDAAGQPDGHLDRSSRLSDLADAALWAGDREKAERYARELLQQGPQGTTEVARRVRAEGEVVLGLAALQRDDLAEGRRRLFVVGELVGARSGGVRCSGLALAQELLLRGEREAVLAYLDQCLLRIEEGPNRHPMHDDHVNQLLGWKAVIAAGRVPDLGRHSAF